MKIFHIFKKKNKKYYYLTVQYEDYDNNKKYNYISDDTSVGVGDKVLVDMAGTLAIAQVLETGYYSKINAPFPIEKTKKIIKKVDKEIEFENIEFYNTCNLTISNTIKMNVEGTYFEFGIFNYIDTEDDEYEWANIKIQVNNSNFNYFKKCELMICSEVKTLASMLEKLLNNEYNKMQKINFYEPDLEINLYPSINFEDAYDYSYIEGEREIEDIYMELIINLINEKGANIGQKYVITFDREKIEKLVAYMKRIIN